MPITPAKDTFDVLNDYVKVVYGQTPVTDYDENEAQDILRNLIDSFASAVQDGARLIGSSGVVTPGSNARSVDVAAGWLVTAEGTLIRLPAQDELQVFGGGVSTGVQESLVYVEYRERQVDEAYDAGLNDGTLGVTSDRLLREVVVQVAEGTHTLPAPTAGFIAFKLAEITHDFDTNGTSLTEATINQDYGISAGELGGLGPQRTLRLTANNVTNEVAILLRFLADVGTGNAVEIRDETDALLFTLQSDGGIVTAGPATINGNVITTGLVDGVDIAAFKSAYDTHTHPIADVVGLQAALDDLDSTKSETTHGHDGTYARVDGQEFTGIVDMPANFVEISGVTSSISNSAFVDMGDVGLYASVHYLSIDPGAYTGTFDVYVYADGNTGAELLAEYRDQDASAGTMIDRVPWFFENERTLDKKLFVRIVKDTTGTAHTFTLGLRAMRFA